jgi:hypothetical protein
LGTGSQYNVAGTQRRSDGTVQTFVQNFTLVSSVSQSASELVGVFLITANSGDATLVGQYQKMKLYLLPDGTLWGGGYVSATAANDYFVATVDDALTHTVFENYVPATGMSKLN